MSNGDPQQDTTSPNEEGFRNSLREVFGSVEWTNVEEANGGYLCAHRGDVYVRVDHYGRPNELWTVMLDSVQADQPTLRAAANLARKCVSGAVAAMDSVAWEVEP